MEPTKILEALEGFKELVVVKLFSVFYSESLLAPFYNWFKRMGESAGHSARGLIIWAIIILVLVFAVDQVFYWQAPGRVEIARRRLYEVRRWFGTLVQRTKEAWADLMDTIAEGRGK